MKHYELIRRAIEEDLPQGDVTTESLALPPRLGTARLIAKQNLTLSGSTLFEETILFLEPSARLQWHFRDGDEVLQGQTICSLLGNLIEILKAERVALNFLMHLSGIATLTRKYTKLTEGSRTKILDTRKTLPGYRELEKLAVLHGGGENHRKNLSEAVLIKDNHIALCGGLTEAVERVRLHCDLPITVEVNTLEQVKEAVLLKVNRILLDNFDLKTLPEALSLIPPSIETEVSGNMTLEKIPQLVKLRVNYISVGAITHSAPAADISLLFDWN
ncbi:MAG: carboxylating nicotinate-nucleotide diphosphorylase [Bdellovibrionaceae bacterium]|nr:carboxylating nicotinate-nucleotide diphosphorylase [Pseudobdellovibrionaceae bacterium]MDW8190382.1 carboxylating nicotinate-nucleotide diphosphorylase [Pseudobdellovibrionaceae bacterium]